MRLRNAFAAAAAASVVTLGTAAPALAQDVPDPTETDPSSVTDIVPLQDDDGQTESPNSDAETAQQDQLQVVVTDGSFTSADREVAFEVTNCDSDQVGAESTIFASTSYDAETNILTATIEEGTESGTYKVTFTCEGHPDLTREYQISKTVPSPSPGDGDDQTTEVPEGGVETGGGGTADGVPAAGWALLAAPALIALRRRGAGE